MPKKIYSDFIGGIAYSDRSVPDNQYFEGREVDIYRNQGYLTPGLSPSVITKSDDNPQIITQAIVDICLDESGTSAYFIGGTDHLYHMTTLSTRTWDADFDGGGHYYYDIPNATAGCGLAMYNIAGNKYLFYAYNTSATKGDIGNYDLTSAFNPNYMSADVGGAADDIVNAPHPMFEWKTYLYVGNGRYMGRFDGATGTWEGHKLDLGEGWVITKLFPTENYIGICAYKKNTSGVLYRTESRVFFWDGVNSYYTYWRPVADNKILTAYNNDGDILLVTHGRGATPVLRRLTDFGTKKIRKFKFSISGTLTSLDSVNENAIDIFGSRVFIGSNNLIISYGGEEEGQPSATTIPLGYSGDTDSEIYCIRTIFNNELFISYSNGGVHYLLRAVTGYSTRATYQGAYTDFGQKVRINYVKFYFKPLVSGDVVTPTLKLDYGTSFTLRDPRKNATISYTNDGAITSKRFDVQKDCHAVAPALSWSAGGTAFSKIIIDYDFIEDK